MMMMTGPVLIEALLEFQVQISGLKMKAVFIKIFNFEELGRPVSVPISS